MHWRYSKINQYDLEGHYVKSFTSCTEASKEVFAYHRCIEKASKGLLKSVAGYQWRKLDADAPNDDIEPLIKPKGTNIKKPVIAINLETKEEKEFPSVLDCAHYLHIDPKNIRETIKGNQTQSKGYTFKLKEEE